MSNILDLFTSKRQSDGGGDTTATLDGVGENDGSDYSQVAGFFNNLVDTYSTVKGAIDGKKATPAVVASQSPIAKKTNWLPWAIGGAVLFIAAIVFLRK